MTQPPGYPQNGPQQPWGPPPGYGWQPPYQPPPGWNQPGVPPWAQQHYPPPQYAPPQPPPRKSWVRRHKILTGLIGVLAVLIVVIAAAAGLGSRNQPQAAAGLAACTSHHAVSSREWLEITKDPAAATGQCITVYGEVSQFDSVTGDSAFRAQAGGVQVSTQYGFADYPTNALFDGNAKMLSVLVEDDLFTAQVTVAGSQSYTTTLGGSTTVPVFRVDSVTRTGHLSS